MELTWKQQWKLVLDIFWSFFKIGPITFGGGYAMIPLIEREVIVKRKWLEQRDVTDVFAVSESVPGSIAINSATFIGYRLAGVRGALAAMLGISIPTFCIVITLCIFFLQVQGHPGVEAAFEGIRAAIVALIFYAGFKIGKTAVLDKTTFVIVGVTVAVLFLTHFHPVMIIVSGAALGVILVRIRDKLGLTTALESGNIYYDYPDHYIGDGI